MEDDKKPIKRSKGVNSTEQDLSKLCDKVFLKLWGYPNPYYKRNKEICDVLVIFEEHIFIFAVRKTLFNTEIETKTSWNRWKKEAIDKQINTIKGAEKRIISHPDKIFLDKECENKVPININIDDYKIHRIVVAHGAEQACKAFSDANVAGSLAISYSDETNDCDTPFLVNLPRDKIYHVFDSFNLDIILGELDTIRDFLWYLEAKERAIKQYDVLTYYGEEDLLAHYIYNFDTKENYHYIGTKDKNINCIAVGGGEWHDFSLSPEYLRKKEEDKDLCCWDNLLNNAFQQAHKRELIVDGGFDVYNDESAFYLMAKEPRFFRRELSKAIEEVIVSVPSRSKNVKIRLRAFSSLDQDIMYVFLQIIPALSSNDYEKDYREYRKIILHIACGAIKNKDPNIKKVVGIGVYAPKYSNGNSEDFILLDCSNWSKEDEDYYKKGNKEFQFFESVEAKSEIRSIHEFPPDKKYCPINIE